MKRLLLTLCCTLATALFALTWTDPETNITWTYTLFVNGKASLGGGSSSTPAVPKSYVGPLTIPTTLNGSPVVALNNYAFSSCSALTSVVIPEGVTSIGNYAFRNCSALTSIVIPESVTTIGDYAFRDCSALTSEVIPEGVTYIGNYAFYGCSALTSVVIPEGVTTIKEWAFSGCTSVKTLSIAATVSAMPVNALPSFNSLESIRVAEGSPLYWTENNILYNAGKTILYRAAAKGAVGEVVIPEGVTSIEEYAFLGCSALTSVDIPASVTNIGYSAFYGCSKLASIVIPEGVTSIKGYAFYNCSALTSVVIPSSVTAIGERAFYNCSSLTSIVIPEGVTSIGYAAFYDCSALASIVIPASVTSIRGEAFSGVAPEKLIAAAVPNGMSKTHLTSVEIPEGVTAIGNEAFLGCSALTSVVIPEGVTSIGNSAFAGCSTLTSVDIPKGVTTIGGQAFYCSSSLTSVVIPEGVTSIGYAAFYDCSALASVVIPSSVTSIGDSAFVRCSALTSVDIPSSVTSIGEWAFRDTQCKLVFSRRPPREGLSEIRVCPWGDRIVYPEEYAAEWEHALQVAQYSVGSLTQAAVTVTAEMTTPKTMKVTYKVDSPFTRAKVRAVAWKDGARSFANIIPVKTVAEGSPEAVPNGETVTTGVEHTFIWQVSADWSVDLAKVAVEVLAEDSGLLPQDLVTIPATETHVAMTITTNVPTTEQLFNALVWYYADGDSALTVSNGVVKINGTQVAIGTSLTAYDGCNNTALLNYLYGKLGYKVLSGSDLFYAQEMTRLSLSNSGLTQLSVKISEE